MVSEQSISAIVLVGSGPSAEVSLAALAPLRERLEIWVTGSALDAALSRGIEPDLVVVTDAALYAAEHLRSITAVSGGRTPIAAPLGATRGIASAAGVFVISEGERMDSALLAPPFEESPVVPPHGTVSATGAMLARMLGPVPIVCVGLDFAWSDGRSHARPHLSESYRRATATRLEPETTPLYAETREHSLIDSEWTTSRSLTAYAEWFAREAAGRLDPLFMLHASPALTGVTEIGIHDIERLPRRFPKRTWVEATWAGTAERRRRVRAYLSEAKRLVERTGEPSAPTRFEDLSPAFAELAIRLALPSLLRWYRRGDSEPGDAWQEVRTTVGEELAAAEEAIG
jgi:hypothetical protein